MTELRDAFRALRATPIVTIVAILSLALGIGANTAIFSIVDSLMLRALPVERPDRLAIVQQERDERTPTWTNPIWESLRARAGAFESAFAYASVRFNLAERGETQFVEGLWASGRFFSGLGVQPMLGRAFGEADDARGGGADGPVAVISYSYWQRRYGGAADVIGKSLLVERVPFTIVGVTPPGFTGVQVGSTFDVAIPIGTEPLIRRAESALDTRSYWWLRIMVRLKDTQTFASAEQALRGLQPQVREETMPEHYRPEDRPRYLDTTFSLAPGATGVSYLRGRYREPILTLMAVVGLVLLIACANIANLLLARAASRRHEFSVRLALGAPRRRLVGQLLAESLMLSGGGALLGLVLAKWGGALLVRQLSTQATTVFLAIDLDWRMLAFTAAVATATALLFGLAPALRAARSEPIDVIREHGRGGAGERRLGLGNLLVAGQVALSLVLVVGAGLFLRTFGALATQDIGFDRDPVLLVSVNAQKSQVEPAQRTDLYQRVIEAVRATPGVAHASMSAVTPVSGSSWSTVVRVQDAPELPNEKSQSMVHLVSPDWFATYGTRIIAGRDFTAGDRQNGPPVLIVNEAFVRKYIANGRGVGTRVREGGFAAQGKELPWSEVVAVVKDAAYNSMRAEVPPTIYRPMLQAKEVPSQMAIGVRAAQGQPALLARSLAGTIGQVDRDLLLTFTPLKRQVDAALTQERLVATLSTFFGALALLLAGLGLYGVTSYAVSRRRSEIGIRMALGATAGHVVRMVLARVGGLVALGVIAGTGLALWASRFVETLLFGLKASDVTTFVVASAVLMLVGVMAGWLPARRAARIDPARVLRGE